MMKVFLHKCKICIFIFRGGGGGGGERAFLRNSQPIGLSKYLPVGRPSVSVYTPLCQIIILQEEWGYLFSTCYLSVYKRCKNNGYIIIYMFHLFKKQNIFS